MLLSGGGVSLTPLFSNSDGFGVLTAEQSHVNMKACVRSAWSPYRMTGSLSDLLRSLLSFQRRGGKAELS